jgi:hypothetical protein
MTMAKKRREIPEKQPQPPSEQRVLPMQLKLGDRLGMQAASTKSSAGHT